jgi:hypothetical protein
MSVNNLKCPDKGFCEPINGFPRFITNYTPNRTYNEFIRYMNKINGSTEYRMFLQNNTNKIIKNLRSSSICGSDCHLVKNDVTQIHNYLLFPGFLKYE